MWRRENKVRMILLWASGEHEFGYDGAPWELRGHEGEGFDFFLRATCHDRRSNEQRECSCAAITNARGTY